MGISLRHYLFAEDGTLCRLPQRIVDELPAATRFPSSPARASGSPTSSSRTRKTGLGASSMPARYWTFDDEGRVDKDMNRRMVETLDRIAEPAAARRGPVVDLVPELKKRE